MVGQTALTQRDGTERQANETVGLKYCLLRELIRYFMPDRITLDRKEFESFLADNQTLVDNSQQLMKRIDELEKANRQLSADLQASKSKLQTVESTMLSNTREADDTIRKARETMTRIIQEADKRLSG